MQTARYSNRAAFRMAACLPPTSILFLPACFGVVGKSSPLERLSKRPPLFLPCTGIPVQPGHPQYRNGVKKSCDERCGQELAERARCGSGDADGILRRLLWTRVRLPDVAVTHLENAVGHPVQGKLCLLRTALV